MTPAAFAGLSSVIHPAADGPDEAAQAGNDPCLDREKLDALQSALPARSVRELLHLFIADTDRQMAAIEQASAAKDLSAMGRNAHNIVSTAGNMGAVLVSSLARDLTNACRANDATAAAGHVQGLVIAYAAASQAIGDGCATWGRRMPP